MQPYFFPYLGHFALIAHVDQWVVFDISQYTPKSWMTRNRVLHPKSGWLYVNAPLQQSSISLKTHQVQLDSIDRTRASLLGKLSHYRGKAPFYQPVIEIVEQAFDGLEEPSLVRMNVKALEAVCGYLKIPFNYSICSELSLDLASVDNPGGWAPEICRQLGATSYLNPESGRALFDPQEFSDSGIELAFLRFGTYCYSTDGYGFEPNLSVLDTLLWNEPFQVQKALASLTEILPG